MKNTQQKQRLQRELELLRGYKRIGSTPEKGLDWVLRFCERDISSLSAGDWQNLIYEVAWFSIWGPPIPGGVSSSADLQTDSLTSDKALPTQIMVTAFQKWAKARRDEFIADGQTEIILKPSSKIYVTRDRQTAKAEMILKTDDLEQGFAFSFAQIMRVAGASLNQCPQCGTCFSARSNQTYCGPRCQNRVSLAKFREAQRAKARQNPKTKQPKRKVRDGKKKLS